MEQKQISLNEIYQILLELKVKMNKIGKRIQAKKAGCKQNLPTPKRPKYNFPNKPAHQL